jgi:hypothetical protein
VKWGEDAVETRERRANLLDVQRRLDGRDVLVQPGLQGRHVNGMPDSPCHVAVGNPFPAPVWHATAFLWRAVVRSAAVVCGVALSTAVPSLSLRYLFPKKKKNGRDSIFSSYAET